MTTEEAFETLIQAAADRTWELWNYDGYFAANRAEAAKIVEAIKELGGDPEGAWQPETSD